MSREFRLGVFIVAALMLFCAGVFWIGSRRFLFASTYRLNAEFPTAAGLVDGAQVRVGGVHQGTVRHVVLPNRPDQKVRVEMDVKAATRDVVKKDSTATIRTEGLVGDRYVEIGFGSVDAPKVDDGDTIATQPPLEIADLMKKTSQILDSAGAAMSNVNSASQNLDAITSKINQGRGSVGALINDRSVYQEMHGAATSLNENMEALKHNFLTRGFFKKRGYEDSAELTKDAIPRLPAAEPSKKFAFPAAKLYDGDDTAKLKKEKMLDEAGKYLERNEYGMVVLLARSDQKGDSEKEKTLTQARAMVARDYLVEHFKLDDRKVKTMGVGKDGGAPEGGELAVLVYGK
jgi:phospholipid/cholesterol/gamma-HCH transport system substrate-binding protein